MTQPPAGPPLPDPAIELRSRPSDVVADPPVVKSPAPAAAVPAAAPGLPPADTTVLAAERATRVADVAAGAAGAAAPRVMTTDSIMPTCMIYSMFAVLFLLLFPLGYWMVTMIVTGAAFR